MSGTQMLEGGVGSGHRRQERPKAVSFRVCCDLVGLSYRSGERLMAEGRFPVPELPRLNPRGHHRFSTSDIDDYLERAATVDVRRRG